MLSLSKEFFWKTNISIEMFLMRREYKLVFFSFKRSFILRDEVYTSITDTIEMPKVLYAPDGSIQPAASPSILATQLDDTALRNFEVEYILFR